MTLNKEAFAKALAAGLAAYDEAMGVATGCDGWIKWDGGERPVPPYTMVDVRLRNGDIFTADHTVRWDHYGALGDIVAYRLAK